MRTWKSFVLGAMIGLALAAVSGVAASTTANAASVLDQVRERGHVQCGVAENRQGLSSVDRGGRWSGLEVEFCAAIAAAVLGDRNAVKYRPINATEGTRALSAGDIDVLLGATAWTLSREAELSMRAAGILFHDGQALMVQRAFGVSSVLELSGASICVQRGTGAEPAIIDYFKGRDMRTQLVVTDKWDDVVQSYAEGRCTLLTGDLSMLAQERADLARPQDHLLLPELVTQESIVPMVRQGDEAWYSVVRWTLLALIEAEELGLSSANVDESQSSTIGRVRRFLGLDAALGPALGLPPDWAMKIVAQVGNYGEIFDRTLGEKSRLKLTRGLNALWTNGGLLVSPAFR